MEPMAKKLCKMCCMEIPAGAKKCPYCQYLQKPFSILLSHPATWSIIGIIFLGGLYQYLIGGLISKGESFVNYADQLQVVESKIQFGESQYGPTVVILGKVHNASPLGWKNVVFHVDISDADGNPVDMTQEEKYSYIIPAGATQSFKVTFQRQFPVEKYVKHKVEVISARDERSFF
jgi:hypothetical protein